MFAVIFYVGKRFDDTSDFKKIFSIMSHCVIPIIIRTATVLFDTAVFYEHFFVEFSFSGSDDELVPSYALDFVFYPPMVFGLIALPFVAWSVMLSIKAVKIVNNFETKKNRLGSSYCL